MRALPTATALVLAAAALTGAAPAAAAAPSLLPPARFAVTLRAVAATDCAARAVAGPGISHRPVTAPARGVLAARLRGPDGGDWDVALLDARTSRVLNGSAGTGAREVAVARVRRGQRILVQACRRAGAGTAGRLTVRGTRVRLAERKAPAATAADPRAAGRLPSGRTGYRTLPELQLELKALAAANPDLVRLFTLPLRSTEGREIMGVEIAEGVAAPPDGRPAFVVVGGLHAREWPSVDVSMEWAHELIQRYRAADPRLTGIVRGARTFIVPVLNVDAFDATIAAAGLHPDGTRGRAVRTGIIDGFGAMKRKSCSVARAAAAVPCLARAGGPDRGVDLNRNFGPHWGGPGAAHFRSSPAFAGAAPFSEPETEGLRRWLRDLHPAVFLANHSFSGLVLRPPGTEGVLPPTEEARLAGLGDRMAAATGYDSIPAYELYPVTGAVDDYASAVLGGLAFTIEIGRRGFHPRFATGVARQYDSRRGGLREAFTLAGEAAVDPGSHGVLRGIAPPGSVLRLTGRTAYETDARARTIRERRSATLVVPPDGRFVWHVTPSDGPGAPPGSWTLSCTDALGRVLERRGVAVARGAAVDLALTCGGPQAAPREATPVW